MYRGKTEIQRISSFKKPAKVIQKIIMYTTREQDLVYQNEVKEIKLLSLLEITNAINENAPVKHLMKICSFLTVSFPQSFLQKHPIFVEHEKTP